MEFKILNAYFIILTNYHFIATIYWITDITGELSFCAYLNLGHRARHLNLHFTPNYLLIHFSDVYEMRYNFRGTRLYSQNNTYY